MTVISGVPFMLRYHIKNLAYFFLKYLDYDVTSCICIKYESANESVVQKRVVKYGQGLRF